MLPSATSNMVLLFLLPPSDAVLRAERCMMHVAYLPVIICWLCLSLRSDDSLYPSRVEVGAKSAEPWAYCLPTDPPAPDLRTKAEVLKEEVPEESSSAAQLASDNQDDLTTTSKTELEAMQLGWLAASGHLVPSSGEKSAVQPSEIFSTFFL